MNKISLIFAAMNFYKRYSKDINRGEMHYNEFMK